MKCQFRPLACEKCKSLVLMSFDVSFFSFFSLPLGLMSFDKFFLFCFLFLYSNMKWIVNFSQSLVTSVGSWSPNRK